MSALQAVQDLIHGTDLEATSDGHGGLLVRPVIRTPLVKPLSTPIVTPITPAHVLATKSDIDKNYIEEQVIVTGTSIRGAAPVGSNITSVDQQAIQASGAVDMQQLLQTVTAISTAGAAPQGESVFSYYSPQIHSLAGSASNSTLVIMDGLRLPGGGTQGYVQTDPNIIPTIAIDHVDVLADGASSVYGSDAVAGVVNFITRKSYQGLQLEAMGGIAADYSESNLGLLWGTGWDKGSVMVAANYSYKSALANNARSYTDRGDYTALGGNNFPEVFGCPVASMIVPGNAGVFLTAASATTVPNTQASHNCNLTVYGDDLPRAVRQNILMKVTEDFTSRLTATLTLNFNDLSTSRASGPGSLSNAVVYGPGSGKGGQINPFYQAPAGAPTATQETITWADLAGNGPNGMNYGTNQATESTMYSTLVATYKLTDTWEATLSDALGHNENQLNLINTFCSACALLALNGTAQTSGSTTASDIVGQSTVTLNTPLTTSNALDVWNPAGSTNQTSALASQNFYKGKFGTIDYNTFNQLKLAMDGPLFDLPAGPVKAAFGAEMQLYHLIHDITRLAGTGPESLGLGDLTFRYNRVVYSAYLEVDVPLTSPEMDIPLLRKIDFDISGRYDKYSDVGPTANPKFALNWEVVEGFRLRGNFSTSFVAPPMGVIGDSTLGGMYSAGASVTNGGITVPVNIYPNVVGVPGCAGSTVSCTLPSSDQGLARQFGGVLSNIKPETGNGWSIGADIAPLFLPGFTANITLFNNEFKGGVTGPTIAETTEVSSLEPNLVICPTGCTAAQVGAFTRVANGAVFNGSLPSTVYFLFQHDEANALDLQVQGIDLESQYQFDTDYGAFKIADNLTEFTKFNQAGVNGPYFSILNTSGLNPTFPSVQMQMRGNLSWTMDNLAADLFVNFTGGYRYIGNTAITPIITDANGDRSGGGDVVKSNTTIDLHIAYNFDDGWLSGDQVYVDGKNIFDKAPPFVNETSGGIDIGSSGYNNFVSNPLGRVVSVGLRTKF